MTGASTTPTYNLKVVVSETGIKPDTLRAWERRYGLPKPQRSKGKHRLYSDYDLETIKWLIQRQEEGLSISRAVSLWNQLEDEGKNPLMEYQDSMEQQSAQPLAGSRIEELRSSWVHACRDFDEIKAEQILAQAFAIYPPETVCFQVLMQGLAEIGEQWYQGEATVQQEHFTSALAMRRLHTLMAASPPPTRSERIIVACPPQEIHAFSPLLISLMLRYRGWHVVYLGADVPRARFESTLESIRPDLVLLTAQQLHTAASLLDITEFLREQNVQVAFGGMIFNWLPDLHKRIPGHFLGARLEDTPHVIENLINFSPPLPEVVPVSETSLVAFEHFKKQQSKIESEIWKRFQNTGMGYDEYVNANMHMARNIRSALRLGDMNYINPELVWLQQLLSNYDWPTEILHHYIEAYRDTAELFLNGHGKPVVAWLEQVIKNEKVKSSN